MRPIRLSMSAFGPFAKTEVINFNELGENPLFLINGPTGSGKSTILDAICFALYGETTGNEREARQMRCDQADKEILTEVVLDFAIAAGQFRIRRVPDQERPKSRGEGTTVQNAEAQLWRLEGDKEQLIVPRKVGEANEEIINLTGLSAAQFRQVMVLPQGKFRDLLLANSVEREAIFEQLFQTHVYSTLQTRLREQANTLMSQLKELQMQQKALLQALELESSEKLQLETEFLLEQLKKLEQAKQQAADKLKLTQTILQQAQQLENGFLDQSAAQAKVNTLLEKQAEIDLLKVRLQGAKKAREIEPIFHETQKQKIALQKVEQQVKDCQLVLNNSINALQALESQKEQLPEKEKLRESLNARLIELESFRKRSEQLHAAQKVLSNTQNELIASQQMVQDQQIQLEALKLNLEQTEKKLQASNKAVADLPEKKRTLEQLTEQGKLVAKIKEQELVLDKLTAEIIALQNAETAATTVAQQKSRELGVYEHAWLHGQAAILAAGLQADEACPVCGSTQHPQTASSNEKLPTEQELNKVRSEVESTRNTLEKLTRQKLLKQEEIKAVSNQLVEEKSKPLFDSVLTLEESRERYKKLNIEIDSLQKIAAGISQLQQQIDSFKNSIKSCELELGVKRQTETEKHSAYAAAKTDMENKQAELPEQYRKTTSLELAISETTQQRDQLKWAIDNIILNFQQAREFNVSSVAALNAAQENLYSITALCKKAQSNWQNVLQKSEFEDEHVFLLARMSQEDEDQLAKNIRHYEDEKLLAQKQLAEKNALIAQNTRPDITHIVAQEKQAALDKNNIDNEYHKTLQRQQLIKKTNEKLKYLQDEQRRLEKDYGVIGKLSDISNGKNQYNLSLQRFVLSVLLDDVLIEASYRLSKMSKGRYQLYRKETVGDKRVKSGLELEVEDAYTGKQRPAATLSGGESFMAALALALGLSDVVQAYAGGIRLDTLFIDEGFGSLDPESLDLAINTLVDLRASGRMIGVISHVEEMKRIIDVRLDVIAEQGVSYTRLVVP